MAATPGEAPRSLLPSKSRGAEPLRSCHLTDIGEVRRLAEEAGEVDRIINFASWYGMIGNAGTVGYNITKEAVRPQNASAASASVAVRGPGTTEPGAGVTPRR